MRKMRNPLRMIGPWMGAATAFVLQWKFQEVIDVFGIFPTFTNSGLQVNVGWTLAGFFAGWGVELLIRKYLR